MELPKCPYRPSFETRTTDGFSAHQQLDCWQKQLLLHEINSRMLTQTASIIDMGVFSSIKEEGRNILFTMEKPVFNADKTLIFYYMK